MRLDQLYRVLRRNAKHQKPF